MNAWIKRCVFNLDLNRASVSEPRTLSGRLFQSLGAKYEKVLPPLVDFAIGVDRYVFFRADTDYCRSSRPITDIRVWCKNENECQN